jgi:hypothetical protein
MIKRRLTIKWFRPMMARCAKVKALQKSSKTWVHSGCTNNKPSASGWGFFIGPPRGLVQTPVRQNAKRFGRQRRSVGLTNSRSAVSNPSRLPQRQPNSKPTAGFFIGPPRGLVQTPVRPNAKAFETPQAVRRTY